MALFLQLIFGVAVLLVGYHYVAYPLLLRVLVRLTGKPNAGASDASRNPVPDVTIIVPIHNEADVIAQKVENLCALSYPREKLSVVLALDGCTDSSRERIRQTIDRLAADGLFTITERATNVGKIAVLNEEIEKARTEVVALTDASAMLGRDALGRAAAHFADPRVGVVCGTYRLLQAGSDGESSYWTYQNRLKQDEAALAAPMGAHGAFYAFRREPWSPLPPDTINDDFILPLEIVHRGYRGIYDPLIVATELEASKAKQDFRRRVRIGAGNLQQLLRMAKLADPRRGWLAFTFLSGKGLRALVPLLLLAAFLASAALALMGNALFGLMVLGSAGAMAAYLVAAAAGTEIRPRALAVLGYFLVGNLAAALGCLVLLAGQERKVWKFSTAAGRAGL